MKVRRARPDDAPAIAAIMNAIICDTLVTFTTDERSASSIAAEIEAQDSSYLVAVVADEVAGFATYGPFRAGPGYAQCAEHTIHLAPTARGQGMGRVLLATLEQQACTQGVHVLVAGISSANPSAIEFHAAMGFSQVGWMPEVGYKWGRRLDLVLMQKILNPL